MSGKFSSSLDRTTHHSSRIFFVSGQAQQALHFFFSPEAAAVSGAGVGDWIDGVVAEAVFPMLCRLIFYEERLIDNHGVVMAQLNE